jgi:hypothetical protein
MARSILRRSCKRSGELPRTEPIDLWALEGKFGSHLIGLDGGEKQSPRRSITGFRIQSEQGWCEIRLRTVGYGETRVDAYFRDGGGRPPASS